MATRTPSDSPDRNEKDRIMRKLIISGVLAALALPVAANAQDYGDVREDRRDLREEQRELDEAQRYGDRDDIREERREVYDARRDYREEQQDYRQDYREDYYDDRDDYYDDRYGYRNSYDAGRYYAPRGYSYRPAYRGYRLNGAFYGGNYVIAQPTRYGLYAPRYSHARWIRHGRDVLLVDTRSGVVIDVRRNRFR